LKRLSALATVLFTDGLGSDVTAIISMTAPVAVVLPLLLSFAAIGSQFSAAVADTAGAGGRSAAASGTSRSSSARALRISSSPRRGSPDPLE